MDHLDQSFLLSSEQILVQEQTVSTTVDSVFWNYHQNTLDGQQSILWTKKKYIYIIKLLSLCSYSYFLFLVPPRTTEELKKTF